MIRRRNQHDRWIAVAATLDRLHAEIVEGHGVVPALPADIDDATEEIRRLCLQDFATCPSFRADLWGGVYSNLLGRLEFGRRFCLLLGAYESDTEAEALPLSLATHGQLIHWVLCDVWSLSMRLPDELGFA